MARYAQTGAMVVCVNTPPHRPRAAACHNQQSFILCAAAGSHEAISSPLAAASREGPASVQGQTEKVLWQGWGCGSGALRSRASSSGPCSAPGFAWCRAAGTVTCRTAARRRPATRTLAVRRTRTRTHERRRSSGDGGRRAPVPAGLTGAQGTRRRPAERARACAEGERVRRTGEFSAETHGLSIQ